MSCTVPKLDAGPVARVSLAELGCSPVLVEHAFEDSMAPDWDVERNHGGRVVGRWALIEALVRAVVMEMADVPVEDSKGMLLVVDQQPVSALFADAANKPFGITVGLWGTGRDLDHIEAFGGEHGIEGGGERGVPVEDQEAKRGDPLAEVHQQVTGGLGSPGRGRVGSHAEQVYSARGHFHGQKDVKSAQRDGVEGEEIGG